MSSHRKAECSECHPNTTQVPHTGILEVNCSKGCHLEDKDKIASLDESYYKSYHENEKFAITRLDDKSSCRVCHPLYPHSENNKVRAMLNMHTGFMVCEVCHLKKDNIPSLSFDWKEPEFGPDD